MRDLEIDFQPRRPGPMTLFLLAIGVVLCLDAGFELLQLDARQSELQARLAQAQRRADRVAATRRDAGQRDAELPAEQGKALRQAVAAISLDWEALFRHIDQAVPEDVSLLAIIPNAAGRALQISGEARHLQAALDFVAALQAAPLSRVTLLSHRIKADDPQHPVVFELAATWASGL